jgi:FtsP/CotA-like multicopper oxidase with cupredoxin domain
MNRLIMQPLTRTAQLSFALSASALLVVLALPAVAQIRPFEPPPTLVPEGPQASLKFQTLMLGAKPSSEGDCEQGSVGVDGRIVHVTLHEMYAKSTIFNPATDDTQPNHMDPLWLRSYGGCKSGPLIPVSPGDTLRVDLFNDLPTDDPSCFKEPPTGLDLFPGVGCFNTINLHTHGLHVSPSGNSDNVLLNIAPQTRFPYEINIPEDHPAGTFWYHAHRHGSTAMQVASGAAGILVVRGNREYKAPTKEDPHPIADIDTILHDASGKPFGEQFFFLQQIPYACFSNPPYQDGGPWQQIYTTAGMYNVVTSSPVKGKVTPATAHWTCPTKDKDPYVTPGVIENFGLQLFSSSIWDTNGRFTSVNGVVQPTVTVPSGEIERWRFVHAGIHDTINLQIVKGAPQTGSDNLLSQSKFSGDRAEQVDEVKVECPTSEIGPSGIVMNKLLPQFEIASDGLTLTRIHDLGGFSTPASDGANYMQPGYRSDVLVTFPKPASPGDAYYCLLDQAAPEGARFNPGTGQGGGAGPSIPQLLTIIHVTDGKDFKGGDDTAYRDYIYNALYDGNPKLPAAVREGLKVGDIKPWAPYFVEQPATHPNETQHATFTIVGGPNNSVLFQVNGKSYDPNVVNIKRQVNTTDDWVLSAVGEPHIFHIHVNPFEIMDVKHMLKDGTQESIFNADGHCKAEYLNDPKGLAKQYCGMWHTYRDTIFVEDGYQIFTRTYYDRYIGEFVIHCHILDHEDAGMMLNIEIVPDLSAPNGGIGMPSMPNMHMSTTPRPAAAHSMSDMPGMEP